MDKVGEMNGVPPVEIDIILFDKSEESIGTGCAKKDINVIMFKRGDSHTATRTTHSGQWNPLVLLDHILLTHFRHLSIY